MHTKTTIEVRHYSWSKSSDFKLPAWGNSRGNWQSGFEKLWGKNFSQLITSHEEWLKLSSKFDNFENGRVIIYVPHNLTHKGKLMWRLICDQYELEYPQLEQNCDISNVSRNIDFPAMAFVLDISKELVKLEDLTILIPHWESLGFLRLCLWSINKHYAHQNPKILVLDDFSSTDTYARVVDLCRKYNAESIQINRNNKNTVADVGKLLDIGVTYVRTKYVCMLDADTIHLSPDVYREPLRMLKKRSVVSVGLDTGLGSSYHDLGPWRKVSGIYPYDISYPGLQTVTNNLFRVMRTADALAIAESIEFSRNVEARTFRDQLGRGLRKLMTKIKESKMKIFLRQIVLYRVLNSQYPAMPPTGDNGVSANHWMEANKMGSKVNIPITSYGLVSPKDGICFQNISGLLIHIALSTRALSAERREIEDAGEEFYRSVDEIINMTSSEENLYSKVKLISERFNNSLT
jgi:hypothetical protein